MKVHNKHYRTVWMAENRVYMINQLLLPFRFEIQETKTYLETCYTIENMTVRGAGAIGATAGFAMAQAAAEAFATTKYIAFLKKAKARIEATRPTARNLFAATERVFRAAKISVKKAIEEAQSIANEDVMACKKIGELAAPLIQDNFRIETHCNAGWLAFVDYGSALSPIYEAQRAGKQLFVYVDETRPRNQGAKLTAWELFNENVPHTIIADHAGASLMMQGKIDMLITGADRIAANGDVANKIGTLEKAIVAHEFGIPFYVAAPLATFDMSCKSGSYIKIEERSEDEILYIDGIDKNSKTHKIQIASPQSTAYNPAFDVTPARYITGIITEKGIIHANETAVAKLFQ